MNVRLIDRSRITSEWKCRRSRYWGSEYAQTGISPVTVSEPLSIGTVWHDAMPRLLAGEDVREVANAAGVELAAILAQQERGVSEHFAIDTAAEWTRWMIGMVYAAGMWTIPSLLRDYEVVKVEEETLYTLPVPPGGERVGEPVTVVLMGRPDVILARKSDGTYWYLEWKTTGSADSRWLRQWDKDVQLMGAAAACRETFGFDLEGAIVQGIYKGFRRDGRLNHKFVWGYRYGEGYLGGAAATWQAESTRARGWGIAPTDEYPQGVIGWVDHLYATTPEVVLDQFPTTLPISIHVPLVTDYFEQIWWREQQLEVWRRRGAPEADRNRLFPQTFSACDPSFGGFPCDFKDCCWNREVGLDPIGSGLYNVREPHHAAEEAQQAARGIGVTTGD